MCPAATSTALAPEPGLTPQGDTAIRRDQQPSRGKGHLRSVTLIAVAALVSAWVVSATGISGAFDAHLRRAYYAIRGVRTEPVQVVMLSFEEKTLNAWGQPPWPAERFETLINHVLRGKPRLVVVAEPGLPAQGTLPFATQNDDRVIGPATASGQAIALEALGAPGLVEAMALSSAGRTNESTLAGRVLDRLGVRREENTLAVNYLGAPLPTIEAAQIIAGQMGQRALEDRVVIVSPGSPRELARVMTPRGEMAAVEVFANGIQGVLGQVDWRRIPASTHLFVALLLGLAVAGLGVRLASSRTVAIITLLGVCVLAIDFTLFALGFALVGATTPLVALFAAGSCTALAERARVNNELSLLKRTISERFGRQSESQSTLPKGDENKLWERVADSVAQYIPVSSMVVGWVPEDQWHVAFETHHNVLPEDISERRRDIRRLPYRPACQDQKPSWSERQFMKPERGEKSLMVPLIAFGRVIGLWIINVPAATVVSGPHLEFIRLIASELANTHRQRQVADVQTHLGEAGEGHMVSQIHDTRDAALSIAHDQDSLLSLLDALPVGGLFATLLGEIRFCNKAMTRFLRSFDDLESNPTRMPLARMLARLTGGNEVVLQELLRELVVSKRTAKLSGDPANRPGSGFELLISVYESQRDSGSAQPAGVVVAVSRAELPKDDILDWSHRIGEASSSQEKRIDLKKLLQKISAEPTTGAGAVRPIMMETPKTVARVRVAAGFSAAFRGLIANATQLGGRGAITLTLKATREEVQIIVNIPECDGALDTAAVSRIRGIVEAGWGRFVVQTPVGTHLEVHIDLPIAA
jgi:CHASE2 domain-containing sensor protein